MRSSWAFRERACMSTTKCPTSSARCIRTTNVPYKDAAASCLTQNMKGSCGLRHILRGMACGARVVRGASLDARVRSSLEVMRTVGSTGQWTVSKPPPSRACVHGHLRRDRRANREASPARLSHLGYALRLQTLSNQEPHSRDALLTVHVHRSRRSVQKHDTQACTLAHSLAVSLTQACTHTSMCLKRRLNMSRMSQGRTVASHVQYFRANAAPDFTMDFASWHAHMKQHISDA